MSLRIRFGGAARATILTLVTVLMAGCGASSTSNSERGGNSARSLGALPQLPTASSGTAVGRPRWSHTASDLAPDPSLRFETLPNGLRFVLSPLADAVEPGTSLRAVVDVGWLMETPEQRGFAHLLEHVVLEDTPSFPQPGMIEHFAGLGVESGSRFNAHTSPVDTTYELDLPNSERELITQGLSALREVLSEARLTPALVRQERLVVAAEERARDTTRRRLANDAVRVAFPALELAQAEEQRTWTIGERGSAQALRRFYKQHYGPRTTTLIVSGKFSPARMREQIAAAFGSWTGGPAAAAAPRRQPHNGRTTLVRAESGASPRVQALFSEPWRDRLDSRAWRRYELELDIAFAIFRSRLEAFGGKEDDGFDGLRASNARLARRGDLRGFSVAAVDGDWDATVKALGQALRAAQLYGFNADEVAAEVASWRRGELADADAALPPVARARAARLMADTRQRQVSLAPRQRERLYNSLLDGITPQRLNETFRNHTENARLTLTAHGPADQLPRPAVLEGGFSRALQSWPRPPDVTVSLVGAKPAFAYADAWTPGAIASRSSEVVDAELGLTLTRIQFANGVSAQLMPTQLGENTVNVAVRFGSGYRHLDWRNRGLDRVLLREAIGAGTWKHDGRDVAHLFRDRFVGALLSFRRDALLLTNATATADVPDQLRLMAALLEESAFAPDADDLGQWAGYFRSQERSVDATLERTLSGSVRRWLRRGDFRYGAPTYSLGELTTESAKAWWQAQRQRSPVEVTIVGDFKIDDVLPALAASLGGIEPRGTRAFPRPDTRIVKPGKTKTFEHKGEPDRAALRMYWETPGPAEPETAAALEVLANALSWSLHDRLRAGRGLAYDPGAWLSLRPSDPAHSILVAHADLAPSALGQAQALVAEAVRALASAPLSATDLARARASLVVQANERRFDNAHWAYQTLVGASAEPARLAYERGRRARLAAVTADDVQRAARRYVTVDKAVTVKVQPVR